MRPAFFHILEVVIGCDSCERDGFSPFIISAVKGQRDEIRYIIVYARWVR